MSDLDVFDDFLIFSDDRQARRLDRLGILWTSPRVVLLAVGGDIDVFWAARPDKLAKVSCGKDWRYFRPSFLTKQRRTAHCMNEFTLMIIF